jgi:hypothetical protein
LLANAGAILAKIEKYVDLDVDGIICKYKASTQGSAASRWIEECGRVDMIGKAAESAPSVALDFRLYS